MSYVAERIPGPIVNPVKPSYSLPMNACDSHAHIFGPEAIFPFAAGRGYTPPDAPVEKYIQLLDHLGVQRGLLVQGNAHGLDNRALLNALQDQPARLRGIAITDELTSFEELEVWDVRGVRGLRFHLFSESRPSPYRRGVGWRALEHFLPMLKKLRWTAQVWCDWRALPELEARLSSVAKDVPLVIDHLAEIPAPLGTQEPSFQALLRLVSNSGAYAKLSAPYRQSVDLNRYRDVRPLQLELMRANPERMLWGSDWPHTSIQAAWMPDDGVLVDLFHSWVQEPTLLELALVKNPERLYWRDASIIDRIPDLQAS